MEPVVELASRQPQAQTTVCPLCSFKFNKAGSTCQGCSVNSSCETIRCPQCQYEYVEDSKIWDGLVGLSRKVKRLFGAKPEPLVDLNSIAPLSRYPAGGHFEVCQINPEDPLRMDRLVSLGVLPGNTLKLVRKKPCLIIRLGETEIALDGQIASDIFVRRV